MKADRAGQPCRLFEVHRSEHTHSKSLNAAYMALREGRARQFKLCVDALLLNQMLHKKALPFFQVPAHFLA